MEGGLAILDVAPVNASSTHMGQSVTVTGADASPKPDIGVWGALSLGVGGIVGGGFFATFGLAVVSARGGTWISFLLGGLVALLTVYSYVRLTIRYPGPGGTVDYVRLGLGNGVVAASINVLLILSYVAVMAVYARALAAYSVSTLPAHDRELWTHIVGSLAIILLGIINYAGAALMTKFEDVFNLGKLSLLGIFITAGFLLGKPDWTRLGTSQWASPATIVSSGMLVFLSYEGFELISNASPRIRNPRTTLPIAFYGSVFTALAIYMLASVVAVGHISFSAAEQARDFALSATASRFLGPIGFGMMACAAVFASASAINADFFGAEKLPVLLGEHCELPSLFAREVRGRSVVSMTCIAALALLALNRLSLHALSAVTSGGFLIVYAAVNFANFKLAKQTGAQSWISALAAISCIAAILLMVLQFMSTPDGRGSAWAIIAVVLLSIAIEGSFRAYRCGGPKGGFPRRTG